jgi:hypothetical protein
MGLKLDYEKLKQQYDKLRNFKELKYSKNKEKIEINLDRVLKELAELEAIEE